MEIEKIGKWPGMEYNVFHFWQGPHDDLQVLVPGYNHVSVKVIHMWCWRQSPYGHSWTGLIKKMDGVQSQVCFLLYMVIIITTESNSWVTLFQNTATELRPVTVQQCPLRKDTIVFNDEHHWRLVAVGCSCRLQGCSLLHHRDVLWIKLDARGSFPTLKSSVFQALPSWDAVAATAVLFFLRLTAKQQDVQVSQRQLGHQPVKKNGVK